MLDPLICGIVDHPYPNLVFCLYAEDYDSGQKPPTIADVLACLNEHHQHCFCGKKLASFAWRANLPIGQDGNAAVAWYKPQEHDHELLACDRRLDELFVDPELGCPEHTIHIMATTETPIENRPPVLERGMVRFHGDVCRVVGSHKVLLPETGNFEDIYATPGCFFIDRSDWFVNRYGGDKPCKIPIIRRGPGFGKTAFLSIVAAHKDIFYAEEPFPTPRLRLASSGAFNLPTRTAMLVLSLDFHQIHLDESMTYADMHTECRRFMLAATAAFCRKYSAFFGGRDPILDLGDEEHPYEAVRKLTEAYGCKLFLAIDNYTSSFLNIRPGLPFQRIEKAIYRHILLLIMVDVETGFIHRGLITGLSLPGAPDDLDRVLPFADSLVFDRFTEDLSDLPEHNGVIGITGDDVVDLLRSFMHPHMRNMDETLVERITARWRKGCSYAARGVIAALKDVQVVGGKLTASDALLDSADNFDKQNEALHLPVSESTGFNLSNSSNGAKNVLRTPAQ